MNLPDSSVRLSALTAKDQKDVAFGVRVGVDMMVLSFVSTAEYIQKLRELIAREEKRQEVKEHTPIQVIAKVERADAIRHMEDIVREADGIMVGRGDLGVEIPEEEVPLRQKELTRMGRCYGKPVIVATQMLESMREHPKATRAEVSDAANAVIDHADAVMLSAESATGKYPVEAVETLHRILLATEASRFDDVRPDEWCTGEGEESWFNMMQVVLGKKPQMHGVVTAAHYEAATLVNRPRPEVPIFVACDDERQAAQWSLRWGVLPFVLKRSRTADAFERSAHEALLELGWIKKTDSLLFLTVAEEK
jgi:pyruvate kinase